MSWSEDDAGEVAELLDGFVPSPLPSANWRGYAPPNRLLQPNPEPSGQPEAPTIFLLSRLEYDEVESTFGGGAPVRRGRLVFSVYQEIDAGEARAQAVLSQALARLGGEAAGRLTWFADEALPMRGGLDKGGVWWVSGMEIPFVGA